MQQHGYSRAEDPPPSSVSINSISNIAGQAEPCWAGADNLGLDSHSQGAGEMAYQLRAPTALAEDLGSIPSTHMVAENHL